MTTPLMPRTAWLGGLAFALAGLAATAQAGPSACAEVAAQARKLPESGWAAPEPLAPWLRRYEPRHPRAMLTAVEQDLLDDPRWRQAVSATPDQPLSIERLRGTPIYRVDQVAGSAGCQTYVLVEARSGQPARPLATPIPVEQPMGLCTTQSAFFATVQGQPALVVGGHDSMIGLDQHYRVSTWDGKAFGPACTLALKLHGRLRQAEQHCRSDAGWCSGAAALARELAQAYDRDRRGGAKLDPEKFADGHSPDRILRTTLRQPDLGPGAAGDEGLQLPLLGDEARDRDIFLSSYANVDVRRLAVWLDGRWWQVVVGRAGIGWRESTDTLVTLYEPLGRAIDAQAGWRFTLEASGLVSATASPE
ncbi:hypothetical protein [Roseateles saccharophilus]|uniref:Uncharacterized protein n=1 Tax=Roseateles saccharophilus TaxID=304 RepID=A0A4R3VF91_ROSSA|nr:hypothetical protein [Roseateles saccharophilus]MDG0832251.1 hypothetical protein [Roseateles saccharophilus]TCV02374.1 hypothetical protein EV671_1004147 [Roseateles saccharophilus]